MTALGRKPPFGGRFAALRRYTVNSTLRGAHPFMGSFTTDFLGLFALPLLLLGFPRFTLRLCRDSLILPLLLNAALFGSLRFALGLLQLSLARLLALPCFAWLISLTRSR